MNLWSKDTLEDRLLRDSIENAERIMAVSRMFGSDPEGRLFDVLIAQFFVRLARRMMHKYGADWLTARKCAVDLMNHWLDDAINKCDAEMLDELEKKAKEHAA